MKCIALRFLGVLFAAALSVGTLRASEPAPDFVADVAPIFRRHCVTCHRGVEAKGGLSLAASARFRAGGDSGPAVESGKPEESLLWERIAGEDADMPLDAEPLSAADLATIRRWIEAGAKWPADYEIRPPEQEVDFDWWAYRALQRPEVPVVSSPAAAEVRNPIDAFILQALLDQQLTPSPEADRRTLIRRVCFDLVGLPPLPQEVEAFVADPDSDAYEKLVRRLLADPRYGERWARHWLDVVHYGDTHGYDKDKPRPNAWPYRDYVIRSLNADKPYWRFVQEQIAGDVLWPDQGDAIEATGFISAGPWDFIGHAEVPEEKIDGKVARNLDRDDMVSSTMNTFASMTVQCARCHNHKFDPVTQEQYYSLQAVFAALDRADRPYDPDADLARRRHALNTRRDERRHELESLQQRIREQAGPEWVELEQEIAELARQSSADKRPEYGYHSAIETQQDVEKWVQVDLGQAQPVREVQLVGCDDEFNGIGAGFGFPMRFRIEASSDPTFAADVQILADHTTTDFPNPGTVPVPFPVESVNARYLRVTATRLAPRDNDYIFALGELIALTPSDENAALGKSVTSMDSIEAPVRWQRKNLVDGVYVGQTADPTLPSRLIELRQRRAALTESVLSESDRVRVADLSAEVAEVESQLAALPPQQVVFAGTVHYGSGAFRGTGPDGGKPREIHVLERGQVTAPGQLVGPGVVPVIPGVDWKFDLPDGHQEGARRVALAKWLTRNDNPLTWRSIANRVWQYHFGRGLVDTPNDFGHMGLPPSHPDLLDWLAATFRDQGQSLKELHYAILTSHTYRQISTIRPECSRIDADNRYLWRMNRRVLDAEAIRDATLEVSGKMNRQMYGPAFQDFVIERPEHSPHYMYNKADPDDPTTHRRSVYRFLVRSQPQPFMETLNCADPSQSVAKRDTSLTAAQALTLLNNQFMVRMSEHFAERLQVASSDVPEQIEQAFWLALSRPPTPEEQSALVAYVAQFGLPNACRVILNLNEFVFID